MSEIKDLLLQVEIKQFKNMSFSLYNYINDEDGYFHQLKAKGIDCSIDDMQSLLIDLTNEEKELIKKGLIERYLMFKKYIEEKNPNVFVLVLKKYGAIYVVKTKSTKIKI